MSASESIAQALRLLAIGGDPTTDLFTHVVIGAGALAIFVVHVPLAMRLLRVRSIVAALSSMHAAAGGGAAGSHNARELDRHFGGTLLADTWNELLDRRRDVDAHAPEDRAPVRLHDVLDERPLIPFGVRRTLLHSLPTLLFVGGTVAMLGGLVSGLAGAGAADASAMRIVGLSLRSLFWGLVFGGISSFASLALLGSSESLASRLDRLVARTHRSLSSSEVAMRGAHAQELGFARVSQLLVQVSEDLRDTIDRGLGRIEQSTASAASLISEEQRHVLELVMEDLSGVMRSGVEQHITALRTSLDTAAENQIGLSQALTETVEQVSSGAEANARVTGTLGRAAEAVDQAATTIMTGAAEFKPLVEHLGEVAGTLERTAARIEEASANVGSGAAPPAYDAVRDELSRMSESFVALVDPLRSTLDRLDGSVDNVAAMAELVSRAEALDGRVHAEEPDGAPADAAPAPAAAPAVEVPEARGGELAAALERSGGFDPAPNVADDREAISYEGLQPVAVDEEDDRGGNSALLGRYRAPRFSIDELPEELRTFTAEEALERARRGPVSERQDGEPGASPTKGESAADETSEPGAASKRKKRKPKQRVGADVTATLDPAEPPTPPVAPAEAPAEATAAEAGNPTPSEADASDGGGASDGNEERRRRRLERFFGGS